MGVHRLGVDAKLAATSRQASVEIYVCETQEHLLEISALFGHSEFSFLGVHFTLIGTSITRTESLPSELDGAVVGSACAVDPGPAVGAATGASVPPSARTRSAGVGVIVKCTKRVATRDLH